MSHPTNAQLGLLSVAILMFVVGGGISLARLRREGEALRIAAKACMYAGLCASLGVLLWHSAAREHWQPVNDNFDALVWLAVLLSLFVMYMQWARPIGGLDWFIMPIAVLLLVGAGVFGRLDYHQYKAIGKHTLLWVHHVSGYAGAASFAIGAAGGAMYVLTSRFLRKKQAGPKLGSLERLEWLMMSAVTLGFALLTVSLVTGFLKAFEENTEPSRPKVLLACLAWLVYAVVMHAPINPRFRGRRAAILSVVGFVLVIGTLIAVQFMPGGKG